ncbi:MAG: hypothetical protein QW474_02275 [Candidatus Aenigmatarchaeota archaeon]
MNNREIIKRYEELENYIKTKIKKAIKERNLNKFVKYSVLLDKLPNKMIKWRLGK